MFYVIYAVVMLAVAAASYIAAQKSRRMSNATVGQFEVPTAEDGKNIPWLFGSREIKAMNVEWFGDGRTEPIQK